MNGDRKSLEIDLDYGDQLSNVLDKITRTEPHTESAKVSAKVSATQGWDRDKEPTTRIVPGKAAKKGRASTKKSATPELWKSRWNYWKSTIKFNLQKPVLDVTYSVRSHRELYFRSLKI